MGQSIAFRFGLVWFYSIRIYLLSEAAHEVNTNNNLQNELDVLNSHQNCDADQSNRYYGDKGALLCLMNKGDIAILGLKNLIGTIFLYT